MRGMKTPELRATARAATSLAAAGLWLAMPLAAPADTGFNWPGWRGPDFNGSTAVGSYPVRWEATNVAWKVALPGKGSSSPIVWRNRVYLTTPADGQDAVLALDRSGAQAWLTQLGAETPPQHRSLGSSCNASPVTDGGGIFAYFKSGLLAALELDGTVRWKTNLVERFGPERLFWDQGTSPVVTEQCVVLTRMHGGESWIAGFDKATGALRWRAPRNYRTPTENDNGYSTPVPFRHRNEPALLVWGADHLTAHRASDGELLWSCGGFNPGGTGFWPAISSPVIEGDLAIVPVGRDDRQGQARVHAIRLGGQGDVTATHRAWQRDDVGVFVTAPAAGAGRIYLLRHRGEVVCLDPATGRTIRSQALPRASAPYYASPLVAKGLLYAAREDGHVFVARVEGDFELLSENDLGEQIVSSPVPAGDRVLFRGAKHLFAVSAP